MQPSDLEYIERSIDRCSPEKCEAALARAKEVLGKSPDMPKPIRERWLNVLDQSKRRLGIEEEPG